MHYGEFGVAKRSSHHLWYLLTSGEVDLGIWGVTLQMVSHLSFFLPVAEKDIGIAGHSSEKLRPL